MANTWDFLGDYKNSFMKSSLQVYTNLSGTLQYVGKTSNEKTLSPNTELVEWYDNTGGVQTLYALDIDKFDFSIGFSFMQVADEEALALAFNLDKDETDSSRSFLFMGSNPNTLPEAEWRLVGKDVGGRAFTLVLRRAIVVPTGEITLGATGSYAEMPVTLRALQDTTVTNTKRDIGYFMIDKRQYS
jgi:hypothetical protein